LFVLVLSGAFSNHHDGGFVVATVHDDLSSAVFEGTSVTTTIHEPFLEFFVGSGFQDGVGVGVEQIELLHSTTPAVDVIENFGKGMDVSAKDETANAYFAGVTNVGGPIVDEKNVVWGQSNTLLSVQILEHLAKRKVLVLPGEARAQEPIVKVEQLENLASRFRRRATCSGQEEPTVFDSIQGVAGVRPQRQA
jgi:hypothetical protein